MKRVGHGQTRDATTLEAAGNRLTIVDGSDGRAHFPPDQIIAVQRLASAAERLDMRPIRQLLRA